MKIIIIIIKTNTVNLLISALLLFSTNTLSSSENKEIDLYDIGEKLSNCAGDFEVISALHKLQRKEAASKIAHNLSNGWLMAGYANYYFSGLTHEMSKSSSDGDAETRSDYWIARFEGANQNKNKMEIIINDLANEIGVCKGFEELVVSSQKQLKLFISEASTLK